MSFQVFLIKSPLTIFLDSPLFLCFILLHFNINEFYKQYQIKRIHRKKLKNIRLDFFFDLNQNEIQFVNLRIDGVSNESFDKYINELNSKKLNLFNKVILRNEIKNFFTNL